MKRIYVPIIIALLAIISVVSCKDKKTDNAEAGSDTLVSEVPDSAVYGKCGQGTSMHNLELVTDDGKTMEFLIDEEQGSDVQGGLLCGDRMTVAYVVTEEGNVATKVINLTTLLGRWTSLDRNFTIQEDGNVESNLQTETRPYTVWSAVNGNIVLNSDTFSVLYLGADSMMLESNNGVFAYKRQK